MADRKLGQIELARLILSLERSRRLPLFIPKDLKRHLSREYILSLKGRLLKTNEDALDAILCLYIAGLYSINAKSTV